MLPHEQTYPSKEVAKATGVTAKFIQNCASRKLITGYESGGGKGRQREFTWVNLMQIGLAASLIEIGVTTPADAFRAAVMFSHIGHDENPGLGIPARRIAYPSHYREGDTYLFVSGKEKVVRIEPKASGEMYRLQQSLGRPKGYIALNVSKVFQSVCDNMGWRSAEVLDAIYEGLDN
ncbi:hypothetical protein JQT77_02690 [Sulfitobacter mediterraneus]|nr:hypothetical protein [Sulfitobacter mediterraneus]MBM1309063.1 hypothetical protein [Sulfitobacter mediterraneus]MBM1321330.1 hypothetical protein [Sulfitobacter mediterraneus]MBM1325217.1 hypothetical protein [Sulfitobacter mediterraneus]MBM1396564.1 hypothetical protein [Sulfitobacter mediterraneus]MBM1400448.1 hypothetical protein [Sulfitobacter mediterraneus]